ncbi:MAG: arylsulfatase, partial [Gemmatimonadetes bacterium]|nr:arylsulfatase [Gemmatimonadota bacterium]
MTRYWLLTVSVSFLALAGCGTDTDIETEAEPQARPNILLIVADDLGYSDVGAFGGEIRTPTIDQLAAEGLRFSSFHALPTCSPTRSALLSGNDNHVAGLGVMGEFIYPEIADLPGYEGHLSDQVATIPEILRGAGYHTYMAGKWHLGEDDAQSPYARGFEQTFTMMNGGGSHWADMRPLHPSEMIYRRNGQRIEALPDDFYSSKDYTDALIEFIDSNKDDGNPFFAYMSYTAPHDPLHAPAEYTAKYSGQYDYGWDALAVRRLTRLQELGLVPPDIMEFPPNFMTREWDSLSAEDKAAYARDMEVYAAMVEYMDMSIGRLFDCLREHGLYENTLIVFFSDNGANGAHATAYPGNADGSYLATFDNSLENRGLPGSFIDLGPSWAQASSAPFRFFKSFTAEGGIKSPLIAKMPGTTSTAGQWNHALLHVTDVMPTFLEAAGAAYPQTLDGRPIRQPIGRSMVPLLDGTKQSIRENEGIGYELFEMRAYFQDDWKLLRLPEPFGTGTWELYNLALDPCEMHDVSAENPDVKAAMVEAWQRYAEANDVV